MKFSKKISILFAISFAMQFAFAQFGVETSISNMYDDNVNNNYEQIKSNVTIIGLDAGYDWEFDASTLRLSYEASYNYYQSVLARTNHFHSANIYYSSFSGDNDENLFRLGGSYGVNINRDTYSVFDHALFSAFTDYKYFIGERFINKFGYTFRSLSFSQLPDFNFTEHAAFMNGSFAVTPTTTAIVQADFGTKFYSTTLSNSSSMRKGMRASVLPSVTQLIGMVKVGQGITESIGISATVKYQWNLQKQTRYLSSDYGFISDDELFDDHYGYEGLHSSITYTHLLTESITAKISYGIQNKIYSTLAAYDLDGNFTANQRSDVRSYGTILLQKNFESFSLKAALDIIRNKSNDAYYDYKNTAFTLELGVPF